MGDANVNIIPNGQSRANYLKHLLDDIEALEIMIRSDQIEKGITRIGAEQEFCLLTRQWRPAQNSQQVLESIDDPHFTHELAKYNLEINLDPVDLSPSCLQSIEHQLLQLLEKAKLAAREHGTKILLTGILPTISKHELEPEYMTPLPRYHALNERMKELRGGDFSIRLRGVDDLSIKHPSVLFEACNTSLQLHFQVDPEDFIASYNWAQAISGPVLGISTNSPLLLGRELWNETRIGLFQQSVDTRTSSYDLKDQLARVTFGDRWAKDSIAEIFKHDVAWHKAIFAREIEESSLDKLKKGEIPKLEALCLLNGSIYRWNRPCYGASNGKAHLRIECRYLPSGPSVTDEMANLALWVGLMLGRPAKFDRIEEVMDFRDAKSNFLKAARTGKESILRWGDEWVSVRQLITRELLPLAYQGLKKAGISNSDCERYLGVIERRSAGQTGAQWKIRNYRILRNSMKPDDALLALTKAIYKKQHKNTPVHEWSNLQGKPSVHEAASKAFHIMSTQLFTVMADDLADLAVNIMKWKNIHHMPVVNELGQLCGLLTWSQMESFQKQTESDDIIRVSDIMVQEVRTVELKTDISEIGKIMEETGYGCLPVVSSNDLIGIITHRDLKSMNHGNAG